MNKINFLIRNPKNKTILLLSLIIFLALIARIYIAFYSGLSIFNTDTYDYFKMANGIIDGAPIAYFPNGYPIIVALMKISVGDAALPLSLIILNVILSTMIVWMTFFLARKILNTNLSLVAAFAVGVWPSQLNYVRQLLTEVPSTFFLITGIFLLTKLSNAASVFAGLSLFFSGMIRSTFAPFGFISVLYLFFINQKKKSLFLLMGMLIGLLSSLTLYKNEIILPPSNLGSNLLISINSNSTDQINWSLETFSNEDKASPFTKYLNYAIENQSNFLNQRASSLWELWGPWPAAGDVKNPRSTIARLLIGVRFPLLLLAIIAVWKRPRDPIVILFAIPIALITLVHIAFFSSPRFIYPVEPLIIILAVLGSFDLWVKLKEMKYFKPK